MRRFVVLSLMILVLMLAACSAATPAAEAPAAEAAATEAPAAEAPTAEEAPADAMAESPAVDGTLPEVNPLEVEGDIVTAGSSTVYPLSEAMAERFIDEGYGYNITIDSIGSGAGFERFCKAGETDVANASRAIKDSEVESCQAIGREPIEFRVGTDALAIVVSPENDWIPAEGLTLEQLALIFSDQTTQWSDIDPAWPAQDILRFSPGTDSGTFDYFIEAVMDEQFVVDSEADEGKGEEALLRAANLQLSEDDNVLVQGVEGSPYAIGYFGFAYYEENADLLRAVAIEGVDASADTVDAGEYPLARPLFIYSTANIINEKPQVGAFINFYLTYVDDEIIRVGYFPAPDAALDAARQALVEAMAQ
jgi:phosphate transport system substrate-binding protein